MAITYVGERATNNNNGTTAAYDVAIASNCSAGNTVIALGRYSPDTASGNSVTVTDSNGNTWTTDHYYQENFQVLWMASTRQDVGTLTTSDTITVTSSQARASNNATFTWVEEFSGMASSGYDFGQNTAAGSGTNLGTGDVTPSADGALIVALIDVQSNTVTVTNNGSGTDGTFSSFTTAQLDSSGVGNNRRDRPVYQILTTGNGVGQAHHWDLASAVWSDRLIGAYAKQETALFKNRMILTEAAQTRAHYW